MTVFRLLQPAAPNDPARALVAEFQSETADILAAVAPAGSRLTLHVLGAFLATGLLLAAVLPIERVVQARGRVTSVAPKIVVQPLETSIIRSLLVHEGDMVKAGQVLARLDPTFSSADVTTLRQRIASLEAEIARMQAELKSTPYKAAPGDAPGQLQQSIYNSRHEQYRSLLAGYDSKIAQSRALIERGTREYGFYQERLGYIREIEAMRTTLEQKQTGSRLNAIVAADARAEIERNVAVQKAIVETAGIEMASAQAERDTFAQKWMGDIAAQIVERQRLLDTAREDMSKAGRRSELIELKAVEDAIVLQVGDISIGSVVESAKKIFVLVPTKGGLQAEVEISGSDQGFVKVGQEVEIKFDAWPYTRYGTAHGVVRTVSGDAFRQQTAQGAPGPAVYVAHIDLGPEPLRGSPADFRLVPGMPLTADVSVGARTPLSYLLDKAMPLLNEGMREP